VEKFCNRNTEEFEMESIRNYAGFSYRIVRSNRKTLAISLGKDGIFLARAPYRLPVDRIEDFMLKNREWLIKQKKKQEEIREQAVVITEEERARGVEKALKIFPERTAYYAKRMGVTYNCITIREQKTRWGSCSAKGNLNFNWKLVLMPPEVLDYVVVHELAHRREMNHSVRFWKVVEAELPDYQARRALLRQYERRLMTEAEE
jgi:hypothetical protein